VNEIYEEEGIKQVKTERFDEIMEEANRNQMNSDSQIDQV